MKPKWTTLFDPQITARYCPGREIHNVCFLPVSENILGRGVSLLIPECELQNVLVVNGELACIINRPAKNKNVKYWVRYACQIATEEDCPIGFSCDTHDQAEVAARRAAKLLPNHRRIALERMYQAETRTFRGLS